MAISDALIQCILGENEDFMLGRQVGLFEKYDFEDLSKSQIVAELNEARAETFKYINRLLEVEEKWIFVSYLLKNLNSIKDPEKICKTICDEFLKITHCKICACYLFDLDVADVKFKGCSTERLFKDKKSFLKLIDKLNMNCKNFIDQEVKIDKINDYFEAESQKTTIVLPIVYAKTFLGYLLLAKNDENFYDDNIHFMSIFPEHIALVLFNLFLYQESELRNKQKIEFLAGISHEFKTPLNSIIGFCDVVKNENTDPKQLKYLDNISHSSMHLLSLIKDVLDVSKSELGALELNYSYFNTKEEILQVVEAFEQMINEKKIDLSFTLCDIKICADVKRFKQLIFNLLSNAVKFNNIGGKIVIISYIKNNKFFFEITDTGDGISKVDYAKIFGFFSQVNKSQLKRELGSGVGLAICKMITDAHNGEIDFKSQFKSGSNFWFSLPLER